MKNLLLSAIILFLACAAKAQITRDTIITPLIGMGYDFHTVQISEKETKYLFEDHTTNTFSLYNMDFTPFATNIAVPEPFNLTFQVLYVSKSLFDCDSTNIEYVYASTTNGYKPFRIMRVDGTQLFKLDSAIGPYCYGGCLGLSDVVMPIRKTSAGTKLFLRHPPLGQTIEIYSLCGDLPTDIFDFKQSGEYAIQIFPNPASGKLTFNVNLPDNLNHYELIIIDNNTREVAKREISDATNSQVIDVSNLGSGTYFYSLVSSNKTYKSGKFILTK